MKICILIIYSYNENYLTMKNIINNYYSKYTKCNDDIYLYYIECNENIESEVELNGDTIFVKATESFTTILYKTMKAIEFVNNKHKDFDFLLRTNISTIFDIHNLKLFLNSIPKKNIYCGALPLILQREDLHFEDEDLESREGNKDEAYVGTLFIQGTCIIFSKDIVQSLCKRKDDIDYNVIDDLAFGVFIKENHNSIIRNSYSLTKYSPKMLIFSSKSKSTTDDIYKINDIVLYRNKNSSRSKDIKHIKIIIDFLINKYAL